VVGHAVAFALRTGAPQIERSVAGQRHDDGRQRRRVVLGQQIDGVLRRQQVEGRVIVGVVVDGKVVAHAGLGHERVKGGQVGAAHGAHAHRFPLGQAHIVAPLALHLRQDRIRRDADVDDDRAGRLDRLRAGTQAIAGEQLAIGRRVGQVRLQLEHRRARLAARRLHLRQQVGNRRRIAPIHHRPARDIGQRQPGHAPQQDACAGGDAALGIRQRHQAAAPAELFLEPRPAAQLEHVAGRLRRQPAVPKRVTIVKCHEVHDSTGSFEKTL
jgi:hypothetical protein